MNDQPRKHSGHDCPSDPENPAPQPNPPGDNCQDLPTTTPPVLTPPAACPDPPCNCPKPPDTGPNCLQELIDAQDQQIALSAKAADLKKDLTARLAAATAAGKAYNRTVYDDLLKKWVELDGDIAELIRKLVCAVPCWRCVIECYVCPLLNDLHISEKWLYGDGSLYHHVHNLYDLRYWYERDLDAKQRTLDRFKKVLDVWSVDIAKTLTTRINDNRTLYNDISKALGTDATKAVYDLFFRLIPMHLAIAPPSTAAVTKIDVIYTVFCECDNEGDPDACCGPDLGPWTFRERLIGPQPYLIDPDNYFDVVCCLIKKRYGPANDAVTAATAKLQAINNEITRRRSDIDNFPKGFDGKSGIPSVIDCCDIEPNGEGRHA